MKIAVLTTDNREQFRQYSLTEPWFGTAPQALLDGFALIPDIEVHVLSGTRQPMKSPEKLASNIWFHSIYVPRLGWTATAFQGCVRAMRRKLKALQPDIVHGQGTERDCSLDAVFSGFPNVLTIHGNMRLIAALHKVKPLSWNWQSAQLEKFVLPRTDGVVCITRYTRDAVKDLARKTWLLPNAVDPSFFGVPRNPDAVPLILCVGLICYRKNQNAFIQALDALAEKRKIKLAFFGSTSKADPYCDEFLQVISTRPWCEHAGFADRETLKKWFTRASVLALPSLEDNCPMVVLEAMAAGIPVVAANVGGVPDLVTDGKTGLFCDPLDAASMRNGVSRLLDEPALAEKLAASAKQEAVNKFHPRVIAQQHIEIYKEVLKERR
ncbi:MAG TPA: glycosyltransferase family 4 protein [Verrucomicrobiae bacterium]|nr:glycosyltransferase family 4 protein [Verrucomicrobiae bacterium]